MKNLLWLLPAMLLVVASCKKDSNDGDGINKSDFYAEIIVDGDTIKMTDRLNGYTNGPGSGGGIADTAGNYLFRQLTEFASPNDTLRIYFIDVFPAEPTAAEKEGVIHMDSYATGYGTADVIAPDANLKEGAAIVYIDPTGTRWTTDRDPQNQPNWSFNVTSHGDNTFDNFSKYLTDLTFSARLYNPLTGDFVDVSVIKLRGRTVIP